jgi:hypothetical protein
VSCSAINPNSRDGKRPYRSHVWAEEFVNGSNRLRCVRCKTLNNVAVPADVRFWDYVDKNGPVPKHRPELGPCWLWTGRINTTGGYPYWNVPPKCIRAHRQAWFLTHGSLPEPPLHLDHLCKMRSCVNPTHLEAVTLKENARRRRWEFCKRGHRLAPPNLYFAPKDKKRRCLACTRERGRVTG